MGGEREGGGKSMGGEREGGGKSMGGERGGGGKRDLLSGRRQERWKIYRPSETRQTIEGQDKRRFLSFFWRFQIELC